jgi:hypothetical protein
MSNLVRFAKHRPTLIRRVAKAFPTAPHGSAEDAVSHAFEVVLRRPQLLEEAERRGGERIGVALLHRIAWRAMRGEHRRPRQRNELAVPEIGRVRSSGETMEVRCLELRLSVEGLLDSASRRYGNHRHADLRRALTARMLAGQTDVEAGRNHHVPREYVNRARNWIAEQLAA